MCCEAVDVPTALVDYTIDAGSIVNLFGVIIAATSLYVGLRAIQRQIAASIFSDYSHRYHEIMKRFPPQLWTDKNVGVGTFSADQIRKLLVDYADFFRLLAGERHLKALGFVDERTWRLWTASTRQLMAQPVSREIWRQLRSSFNYDPNFQRFVDGIAGH